jgi:site-specific recombinase XerD
MSNQVAENPVEQAGAQRPQELTWAELLKKFFEVLKANGKAGQEGNFKTAFKYFLISIGLTKESQVGAEFGDEFEAKIKIYIEYEVGRKLKESTYNPRVSKIRELKRFAEVNFAESLRFQTLPETFGQKINKLITSLGFTIMSFWKTLPKGTVSYGTLANWCKGRRYPSKKYLPAIRTIEVYLRAPAGTFRINKYHHGRHNLIDEQSDSGNKVRAALAKPYYIWTTTLQEEFKKLFIHKTEAILPEGEERHDNGQWTSSEGAEVPSAEKARRRLQSFMGFCALPQDNPDPYLRGQGIKLEELSLALLAVKELVEAYLEFMRLRSGLRVRGVEKREAVSLPAHAVSRDGKWEFYDAGGKYNNGSIEVLSFISSLLRPRTGYLYQHPEFAEKLGSRITAGSWRKQCAMTRSRVVKVRRDILLMKKKNDKRNFALGRDPKERIGWILELKRPLFLLQEMLGEMLADLLPESVSKVERARQYRDLLLYALLCANPLRVRMFSIMEFDRHLIRSSDGSWQLRFDSGEFKNRRSLESEYEVGVARELWPILERYREEFHPILAGSTKTRHVFIGNGKGCHRKKQGAPLSAKTLSYLIERLTERYVPGGMGFGPHAFRHIVATDIIKEEPQLGFLIAARALHDKHETVEKVYIHLKTSEFFEPVNMHFAEAWRQVFNLS